MQRYYGDEPHIISSGRPRRGNGCLLVCAAAAALCAAALIIASALSGMDAGSVRLQRKTWYYLVFYTREDGEAAKLCALSLAETGGAGFIINDGSFRVAAAVYPSESDARKVAAKQTAETSILPVAAEELRLGFPADKSARKVLIGGFDAYADAYAAINEALASYDRGESTESALLLAAGRAREVLADAQRAVRGIESMAAFTADLSDFLAQAVRIADDAIEGEGAVSSRLRYAQCAIVYARSELSRRLSRVGVSV